VQPAEEARLSQGLVGSTKQAKRVPLAPTFLHNYLKYPPKSDHE